MFCFIFNKNSWQWQKWLLKNQTTWVMRLLTAIYTSLHCYTTAVHDTITDDLVRPDPVIHAPYTLSSLYAMYKKKSSSWCSCKCHIPAPLVISAIQYYFQPSLTLSKKSSSVYYAKILSRLLVLCWVTSCQCWPMENMKKPLISRTDRCTYCFELDNYHPTE